MTNTVSVRHGQVPSPAQHYIHELGLVLGHFATNVANRLPLMKKYMYAIRYALLLLEGHSIKS